MIIEGWSSRGKTHTQDSRTSLTCTSKHCCWMQGWGDFAEQRPQFQTHIFVFLLRLSEYTTKIWCTTNLQETAALGSFVHFSTFHIWSSPSSATQRWDAPLACLCLLLSEYFGLTLHHWKKALFNVFHWQAFSFPTHPSSAGKHITHANTPTEGERDGQFEHPVLFPNL